MTTSLEQLRLVLQPRTSASDGQLLEQYLRGDGSEAFTELVRRHGPMVFGVCRRVLRHHQEAEDAFQAVFLVLARKAGSIRPREQLPRWLYGVAYHTALKARALLHKRRARETPLGSAEPAVLDQPEVAEWQAILDEEVQQLPAKYRDPVLLCGLQGQPRKAAAERLGLPEGTVAGRFFRAKQILAARLRRRGVTLPAGGVALALSAPGLRAAVPRTLLASAVRLGKLARLGAGPGVPDSVHLLSQGVGKAMSLSKTKLAVACGLCLLTLTAGVGYFGPSLASSEEGRPTAEKGAAARPDREPIDPELALDKGVQKELRLSDNQIRKLKEAWEAGKTLTPDEQRRREELARQIEEMEKKLNALREQQNALAQKSAEGQRRSLKAAIFANLSDRAQERLRQLTLHRMGLRQLLMDPRIQARLGINDEQIKKLQELQNNVRITNALVGRLKTAERVTALANLTLDYEVVRLADNQEEILKILTPKQREAWKKMIGEPFPRPDPRGKK